MDVYRSERGLVADELLRGLTAERARLQRLLQRFDGVEPLIAAIYALVVIASLAGTRFSIKNALVLATILAIGSYLTFIIGLSLQFQVWPTFISG